MIESIILGIVQGITEWLPISSSGALALIQKHVFHSTLGLEEISRNSLFLHLGTFASALVYFRKDVANLIREGRHFREASQETQNIIRFLAIATLISGLLGILLIKAVASLEQQLAGTGSVVTFIIGICLLITGFLQLRTVTTGQRTPEQITMADCLLLGVVQGFAALPGFSRSGLTMAALLLRRYEETTALRLSFLMSLPIVLAGNIVMEARSFSVSTEDLAGVGAAFVFGLLTIHGLIRLAQKINFGTFVIIFGVITVISAFV